MWVVVWEVDGERRMEIPASFHLCFRIAHTLGAMQGPGILYIQGVK